LQAPKNPSPRQPDRRRYGARKAKNPLAIHIYTGRIKVQFHMGPAKAKANDQTSLLAKSFFKLGPATNTAASPIPVLGMGSFV